MPRKHDHETLTVLVQTKISSRAAKLMKQRADADLRSDAGYLRNLIYRDLGLVMEKS